MAPSSSRAAILCSHIFVAASAADILAQEGPAPVAPPFQSSWDRELDRIKRGDVGKDELEIVLAQYKENLDWSDPLAKVRTIYCKGGDACGADAIKLENIGRESHTFLHHIVSNYDKLANWTVFSQAEEPTEGYTGRGGTGGHMLTGASFMDYVLHPHRPGLKGDSEAFFLMTHSVHLPTLQHASRSTFKIHDDHHPPRLTSVPGMCPEEPLGTANVHSSDHWKPFEEHRWLRSFLAKKCWVEEDGIGEAATTFWDTIVQLPRPPADIVHFAQGSRFAVSRKRLHERPKSYYEAILSQFSADDTDAVDPCMGYMMEWVWWYIAGRPEGAPCGLVDGFVPLPFPTRQLADDEMVFGGMFRRVAGISGSSTTAEPPVPCTTFNNRQCLLEPFSCFWSGGQCYDLSATVPCTTFNNRRCLQEPLSCFWDQGQCYHLATTSMAASTSAAPVPCTTFNSRQCDNEPVACAWYKGQCYPAGTAVPCTTFNQRKCLMEPIMCFWDQGDCHHVGTTSTAAPSTSSAAPSSSTTAAFSSTAAPVPCTTFNNRKCLQQPLLCFWDQGHCHYRSFASSTSSAAPSTSTAAPVPCTTFNKRKCLKEPLSCFWDQGHCHHLGTTSTAAPSTSSAAPPSSTTAASSTAAPVPCTTFNNRKCLKEPLACVWDKGHCHHLGTTSTAGPSTSSAAPVPCTTFNNRRCLKFPASCVWDQGNCHDARRLQYSEDSHAELGVPGFLI